MLSGQPFQCSVHLGDADCGGVAVVGDIEDPYLLLAACIVPALVCCLTGVVHAWVGQNYLNCYIFM